MQPLPNPGNVAPTIRLNALDGLRGLAVLLVFLAHFSEFSMEKTQVLAHWEKSALTMLFYLGQIGVDLFFALSGYLIYDALIRPEFKVFEYIKRRTFRIYPVFLFVLALYLILIFFGFNKGKADFLGTDFSKAATIVALNLLLVPLIPTADIVRPIITATWSLAYEVIFYIFGPLVTRPTGFYRMTAVQRLVVLAVVIVAAQAYMAYADGFARPLMFFAGIVVSELSRKMKLRSPSGIGVLALLLVPVVLAISDSANRFPSIEIFILFGLVLFETVTPNTLASKLFSGALLCRLGIISYSFYLGHTLILRAYFKYAPALPELPALTHLLPSLLLVSGIAWVMYKAIEAPFISATHKPIRKPST